MALITKIPREEIPGSDDMHGALKALLLINEHLEAELSQLRSPSAYRMRAARRTSVSLH
jgi:hypothetical protein